MSRKGKPRTKVKTEAKKSRRQSTPKSYDKAAYDGSDEREETP